VQVITPSQTLPSPRCRLYEPEAFKEEGLGGSEDPTRIERRKRQ